MEHYYMHYWDDKELNWKEKGLLSYMLSYPQIKTFILLNKSRDGSTSFYSGIKSLIQKGYFSRYAKRDIGGKFEKYENAIMDFRLCSAEVQAMSDEDLLGFFDNTVRYWEYPIPRVKFVYAEIVSRGLSIPVYDDQVSEDHDVLMRIEKLISPPSDDELVIEDDYMPI